MILSGRGAVITGASSGIGREIAWALAREGARVIVGYRTNEAGALACVAEIGAAGGQAWAVAADVCERQSIERLIDAAEDHTGGIDIWANVAGADILTGAGAKATDEEKLNQLIAVDLRGTIDCCWAAAPRMNDGGVIINLSWDLALRGMAGRNPEMFAAVKAGITGFTRSFALSSAPRIRVNEIAPGWIATAFAETAMDPEYRAGVIADTPLARLGTPRDVAAAALYLASDGARFVTGQTLKVNGGLSS